MSGIMSVELPGIRKVRSGKVREVFDLGDVFLIVATDRISAFDCILPDPIPEKANSLLSFLRSGFKSSTRYRVISSRLISRNFQKNSQPLLRVTPRAFDAGQESRSAAHRMRC